LSIKAELKPLERAFKIDSWCQFSSMFQVTQRTAILADLTSLLNAPSHPTGILEPVLPTGVGSIEFGLRSTFTSKRSPFRAVLLLIEITTSLFATDPMTGAACDGSKIAIQAIILTIRAALIRPAEKKFLCMAMPR